MAPLPQNPGDGPLCNLEDRLRKDVDQDDSTPTTVTTWRHRLSSASSVYLLVFVMAVALGYMIPISRSNDLSLNNRSYCHRILDLASHVDSFPLPLPINRSAYEVVLTELRYPEGILSSLVDQHTEVCSSLTSTSEELGGLARAAAVYACPDSNFARTSFRGEIKTARYQLGSTAAEVQTLADLYSIIRKDYRTLHASAVEASKAAQLSDFQEVLVKYNPWILWKVGIDAHDAYVLPLKEKRKQEEGIRLGLVVLEREVERLERIMEVVRQLDYRLDVAVSYWDTDFEGDCVRRQKRFQHWLKWYIIQNELLNDRWNELLATVSEGEEKIAINITTEWCER